MPLMGNFRKRFSGRIGPYTLPPPTIADVGGFVVTKLCDFGYALLLPLCFHPWLHVLLSFVGVHLLFGVSLSVVCQLAHTVERTSFPTPDVHAGMMPTHGMGRTLSGDDSEFCPEQPLGHMVSRRAEFSD